MNEVRSAAPEATSADLRTLEEKRAAIAEFRKFCDENIDPDSVTSLYVEQRRAQRKAFPGTLVDLGRKGIIKVRAFGEDGWYDVEPEDEAVS